MANILAFQSMKESSVRNLYIAAIKKLAEEASYKSKIVESLS
jgi:hypothetical protein